MNLGIAGIAFLILTFLGTITFQTFTTISPVIEILNSAKILLAFITFADSLQGGLVGVIRGLGIMKKAILF